MTKRLLSLLACLLVATPAMSAEPIGRLFFSPLERAELDKGRSERKTPAPPVRVEPAAVAPPVAQSVSYSGIVRRSDGRALLWVNNRLVDEKEALAGLNLRGHVRADGAVVLDVPQTGGPAEMKVGQSLDVRAGRVSEGRMLRELPDEASIKPRLSGSAGNNTDQAQAVGGDRTLPSSE